MGLSKAKTKCITCGNVRFCSKDGICKKCDDAIQELTEMAVFIFTGMELISAMIDGVCEGLGLVEKDSGGKAAEQRLDEAN